MNQDGTPGRYSATVRSAFAQAYRNNRVQCVAMGNHQGTNPNVVAYPAGFNSGVIAVGATDDHDNTAGFSAQGPHIDVSAPGVGIWSTNFNNGYIDLSGTSMATPHVAGLASLLKGFNPNLANDDIEQIIRLTADDRGAVGFDNVFGTGRINALRALQSLQAPNTLQQLSTTGGTIFNTSASMIRIFLGVPGFADAAYTIKRSEVRKAITFPSMCNIIGVWGRGVGTTGYREEMGYNYGEGICEVVPGTLTATGCTLRTFIYEVWSITGQYLGYFPRSANNVVFQYSILGAPTPASISGNDVFCGSPSPRYSIPNLPLGATVTWTATPSGIVTINTPNSPQTTLTKINDGAITLNATVSNACGRPPFTISKQNIAVGKPKPILIATQISGPGEPTQIEVVASYSYASKAPIPGATYNWYKNGVLQSTHSNTYVWYIPCKQTSTLSCEIVNVCGTSQKSELQEVGGCKWFNKYSVSPNPARNIITVTSNNVIRDENLSIKKIRIYDAVGNLKQQKEFNNVKFATINISDLYNGTYFIEIWNDQNKERHSLIKR